MLTLACLLFTAVVAPLEVAFMETRLNALFVLNRLIDIVFILVRGRRVWRVITAAAAASVPPRQAFPTSWLNNLHSLCGS